ncbi:MAG: DUF4339 domain-containing protein [Candidatus Lindowbacteria bacterium]|nr:DUF4339 domain-containing protein [Candidatus Lindowbacteria bacterium]
MSNELIWFLNTAEGQTGPHSVSDIKVMITSGQITQEWHVWKEGAPDWQSISAVSDFSDEPEAPASPPPAPLPPQAQGVDLTKDKVQPEAAVKTETAVAESKPKRSKKFAVYGLLLLLGCAGGYVAMDPTLLQTTLEMVGLAEPPPININRPPIIPPADIEEEVDEEEFARQELLRDYYEILSDRKADYTGVGAVLEQLWAHRLAEENTTAVVVTGLKYEVKDTKKARGLDIVLFDAESEKVLQIVEVKLTTKPEKMLKKDKSHFKRFRKYLKDKKISRILSVELEDSEDKDESDKPDEKADKKTADKDPVIWPLERFDGKIEYLILGSINTKDEEGWDGAFDLTREEGNLLQEWLQGDEPPALEGEEDVDDEEEIEDDDGEAADDDKDDDKEKYLKTTYKASEFDLESGVKSEVPEGMVYIKNIKSDVLHHRSCKIKALPDNNDRIYYTTFPAATKKKYKIDEICMAEHLEET